MTSPTIGRQELFNKVTKHLLAQNKVASLSNGRCAYKSESGLKCAIGCLISDEKYQEVFERRIVNTILKIDPLVFGFEVTEEMLTLLRELQKIHDWFDPEDWMDKLKELASAQKLAFDA